jgi:hypothetical protein
MRVVPPSEEPLKTATEGTSEGAAEPVEGESA